uniref:Uncharacterized protein n=1 Tax=Meloidogyne incognita TaxID=6306 RepID=A0A914LLX3_MELIC
MAIFKSVEKNPSHILYQLLHSLHYPHLPSHIFHIITLKATTTTTISLLQYFYPPNLIKIIFFHHQIQPLHISLLLFLIDTTQKLWLEVLKILGTQTDTSSGTTVDIVDRAPFYVGAGGRLPIGEPKMSSLEKLISDVAKRFLNSGMNKIN